MSKGGRLWKGKVLPPFPSVVFHELLEVCSFLNALCFVFENVLKSLSAAIFFVFNFCIGPQEC